MTTNEASMLRGIALDLMALTGLPQTEIALRAQVHRPNLVSWLGGKDHVLSEQKQLAVCSVLGWRYGRLARGQVHRWAVGRDFSAMKRLLEAEQKLGAEIAVIPAKDVEEMGEVGVLLAEQGKTVGLILIQRPLATLPLPGLTTETLGLERTLITRILEVLVPWDELKQVAESEPEALAEALNSLHGGYPIESFASEEEWDQFLGRELCRSVRKMTLDDHLSELCEREQDLWLILIQELLSSGLTPEAAAACLGLALPKSTEPPKGSDQANS